MCVLWLYPRMGLYDKLSHAQEGKETGDDARRDVLWDVGGMTLRTKASTLH